MPNLETFFDSDKRTRDVSWLISYPNVYDSVSSNFIIKSNTVSDIEKITPKIEIKETGNSSSIVDFKYEYDKERVSKAIIDCLSTDEYIEGEISKTQFFLEVLYKENEILFRDAFQKAWLSIYSKDAYKIYNFICVASSIEYGWLQDRADALVIGGYAHQNVLVNEATIRAIESWGQKKHVEFLKAIKKSDIEWLEDYKSRVVEYLGSLK